MHTNKVQVQYYKYSNGNVKKAEVFFQRQLKHPLVEQTAQINRKGKDGRNEWKGCGTCQGGWGVL